MLREYTYDRFGNVSTIKDFMNPGSTSAFTLKTFTYDQYGRPVKLEVTDSTHGSTVMESDELEFDKASNITKETIQNDYHIDSAKQGTEVREYSYDSLDQLTGVVVTRGEETTSQATYTYDSVGNRLTETKDGEETDYTYNSLNQLTASVKATVVDEGETSQTLENKTYTYDQNGAQTQVSDSITAETDQYSYDTANRLSTYVKQENGATTLTQQNQYNGADQRIKKTETAGTSPTDVVNYFYQDGEVLYTTGSDKNKAFNILGAEDNIIATEHQNTSGVASYFFYNKDLRGSTTNILSTNLTAQVSYDYDWFGNTEVTNPENSTFYNQICYTGGIYDESTQQYYLNARFYDPEDGRFISQDTFRGTLEDANSWNLYTYCANNPVKYSDPSGHFIWFAIGAVMAVCDGVSAYHKAKKQGKKGWKLVGAVAKKVAVGAVFGKVGKAFKAGKVVAKATKKVFKSKTVKKLEKKLVKKIYKRPIHKKTISKTGKVKRKAASSKKTIVIGETQPRVDGYARKIGAESYTGYKNYKKVEKRLGNRAAKIVGGVHNAKWIIGKMARGYHIKDIGYDVARSTRSPYYRMERVLTKFYKNKESVD